MSVPVASPLGTLPQMPAALDRVERELADAARAHDPFLTEVAGHLVQAGGKRLRPAMCVAAALAGGPGGDGPGGDGAAGEGAPAAEVIRGAVAVELVHLGSLYHDDVIDNAETRRSVPSVNARWGNLRAILAGDFLLARASELAASLGTEVAGLLAATIGRLCEGEVAELQSAFDVDRTEEAYVHAIAGKTASLFATACRIGALVGGLPRAHVEALTLYGQDLGLAFQVVDDVLDVVATEEALGKPAGHDLDEGIYTLPVLRALAADDGGRLRELLGRTLDGADREEALALVRHSGAVEAALAEARRFVTRGVEALAALPDNAVTATMRRAGDHLLGTVPA